MRREERGRPLLSCVCQVLWEQRKRDGRGWKGGRKRGGRKREKKNENRIDAVIWVSHFRVTEFVCVLSCML